MRSCIDVGLGNFSGNNSRLSSSPQPERTSLSSSTGKITGPFKCSSLLDLRSFRDGCVQFSKCSLSLHPGSRQLHPTVLLIVRSGTLAPLDVSRQKASPHLRSCRCCPGGTCSCCHQSSLLLFHGRVSDELGSNLLELCATLLVDTSGVSYSETIKPVTRTLKVIFSACVRLLNGLLNHLDQNVR